jgi:chorismate-pyruvate lyase
MITVPAIAEPALELRRMLESGGLLTPWAEARCGQRIEADISASSPFRLFRDEAASLGVTEDDNWAALRRAGELAQADGTPVARVTSIVVLSRITPDEVLLLRTTRTPLGTVLGPEASSEVLWCSENICEFAVTCGRLILRGGRPAAMTTDQVYWSWLGQVSG